MKILYLSLFFVFVTSTHCQVFVEEEGKTYEFAEMDRLEAIDQRVIEKKPYIEKKIDEFKAGAREKMEAYQPPEQIHLPRATANREFRPSTMYTLEQNIYDAEGKVLYPKGFQYRVSKFVRLPYEIVVFDATDPAQKEWVIKNNYHKQLGQMLTITDGRVFELQREFNKPVYFMINKLQERFELKKVPCIIKQVGDDIIVNEICINCEDLNTTEKKEK